MAASRSADARSGDAAPAADICFSVDVEWAHDDVLHDLVAAFDERGLPATFFCTHAGIDVPGHERALHPNFRRNGPPVRALRERLGDAEFLALDDRGLARHILEGMRSWAPEARGVRSHSLFFATEYLDVYASMGLTWDASTLMQRVPDLQPGLREPGVALLPTFFMDHAELLRRVPTFTLASLDLDRPGLKVFAFHPNLVYLNARGVEDHEASRPHYHDVAWLRAHRRAGRGVRTLFFDLLDWAATHPHRVQRLSLVADACLSQW